LGNYFNIFNLLLGVFMSRVGLLIKFTAQPEKYDDLIDLFRSLVATAQGEAGTEDWAFHLSPIEPNAIWLYEVYKNQESMDFHNSTVVNAQAKLKIQELTVGAPEVLPLIPIAGKILSMQ
jgi:quinol monooxygenase YgiN